jgi:23S rRNA pseudouridine2605 synthase
MGILVSIFSVTGTPNARRVGLARTLSKLGYCSRSQAFQLIGAGRVRLNGNIRHNPESPVNLERDRIQVDGRDLETAPKIYLMLNKPRGFVTTASDEKGRQTVYTFVENSYPWVAPVGRLDKASEGLLLLTNDSEWAARVLAPETHLEKTYHVHVNSLSKDLATSLVKEVKTSDGDLLRAKSARVLRTGGRNSWLEIVLDEGKNRQIRRLLAYFEVEVLRLVRTAIGPLVLGELGKGSVRPLRAGEKHTIDAAIGLVPVDRHIRA